MIDMQLIRDDRERIREAMRKVGDAPALIDRAFELDLQWRALTTEVEALKAERNRRSKQIAGMAAGEERDGQIAAMRRVGEQIKVLDVQAADVRRDLDELMLRIPNVPDEDVPAGADETENVVVRSEGELPALEFAPRPHWELGPELGILDFDRGVKLSGSRFYVLMGQGARLQRALIAWMLDLHVREKGYVEVYPPYMVNRRCLVGTGQLPKFADNVYHEAEDDLWLIPTAEVPLTNLHAQETLDEGSLPLRYVACTPCFRREKMSAGRDVRGIKRGHQFDKVELVRICRPDRSDQELAELLNDAEDVCRRLKLPHRVVEMCSGDLSFSAARKFDVEIYAAGCGEWLEVSSCSNFRDFQARRAGIRFRAEAGGAPQFAHTLNGSALALPRTLIAILENYQQPDGSVAVPEVLRPYMGGADRIARA
ncbi:MAG: serine--tRNA ligase [Candidatus Brocadiaceae bacterium]|nr:serine--tRNA ligase [Candidatus Brocadiaceae bacterium]